MKNEWYILEDGESEEGMGLPKYVGRTVSGPYAKDFWEKIQARHSCGRVWILTDTTRTLADKYTEWRIL